MANKLKNMRLTSVDLVRNGANQEADICLFKSAEEDPTDPTTEEKNIFKRFINWLRENPTEETGEPADPETVEKDYTTFESLTTSRENNEKLWQYSNALTESIRSIQMDHDLNKEQKYQLMCQSMEQFDEAMGTLLKALCNTTVSNPLAKSDEEEDGDDGDWEDEEEEEDDDEYDISDDDEVLEIEEVEKFNPYHDGRGRFASANGGGKFYATPGKSKAHDLAIEREKKKQAAPKATGAAKYESKISGADSIDELDKIVEDAANDDSLTNDEYFTIYSKATQKAQSWQPTANANTQQAQGSAANAKNKSSKNSTPDVPIDASSYTWFKHGKEPGGVDYYSYEVTHGNGKLSTYNFHGDYNEGLKRVMEKYDKVSHISVGV